MGKLCGSVIKMRLGKRSFAPVFWIDITASYSVNKSERNEGR